MAASTNSPTKAVYAFLERRINFYLSQLVKASGLDRRKLFRVLEKLRREGYLAITDERTIKPRGKEVGPPRRDPRYRLMKDIKQRRAKRPECARDKIWRTLRHLRRATRSDLIRLSGCSQASVEDYTFILRRSGHIKSIGRQGNEKVWLLIKDTGPKKPIIPEGKP